MVEVELKRCHDRNMVARIVGNMIGSSTVQTGCFILACCHVKRSLAIEFVQSSVGPMVRSKLAKDLRARF